MLRSPLLPALAASWAVVAPALAGPDIEPGRPFPDRVLPTLDHRPGDPDLRSLAAFRGEKVLLCIFASW